jgi:hypothetical protein
MEQIKEIFNKYKNLIIEASIGISLLVGSYFGFSYFISVGESVTKTQATGQLLGPKFVEFLQLTGKDAVNLDISFLENPMLKQLQDFTEEITESERRGRDYPFYPKNAR